MLLTIELIPATTWGLSLSNLLTKYNWDKVGKQIKSNAQFKCEICGRAKGDEITRLECHEVWDYDFTKQIQKLIGLQCLCFECHKAKHPGFSKSQSWIDEKLIENHFIKINKITNKEYKEYLKQQTEIWHKASKIEWTIDYGEWSYLLDKSTSSEDFRKEQIQLIYDYLKNHKRATNKEIYQALYSSSNLLKTTFSKLATEARKKLKQNHLKKIFK